MDKLWTFTSSTLIPHVFLVTLNQLPQANALAVIQRRAEAAGIARAIGNHTFRATGIMAYLKNGGTLEKAMTMASHSSTRTTQLMTDD